MKLTFAYSPCPNDTFMFEPIVSGRIDTEGLRFDIHLADVEELNQAAANGKYDITKLSFNAYTQLTKSYQLLNSGSALGRKCGPLLISTKKIVDTDIANATIAIPGENTTANFLLSFAYPTITKKKSMLFSEVERAVLAGEVDAGVIIHENRFTYQDRGLIKITDLGEHWESKTGYPIPLGGIVTRRRFTEDLRQKIDRVIARSVAYALTHPESGSSYISLHAQEMDIDVMQSHIELYVNDFSADIGAEGQASIQYLFDNHPAVEQEDIAYPLFIDRSSASDSDFLSANYWTNRYKDQLTGWNVGSITTPLKNYIDTLTDKSISILIPGAGYGHEAEYLYENGFHNITVCDFSAAPLKDLNQRCPQIPVDRLIHDDFFNLSGSFDLIIEQTFLCALDPSLRSDYAAKMKSLLTPNGKLVGLLFNLEFPFTGPPFGGTIGEYRKIFAQYFDNISIRLATDSIEPRRDKEVFIDIS